MKQNKIYSLLGLAMRGRNLVSGEFQTEDAVKKGSAMLVIVAEDVSANTKKLFHDKCSYYEVPAELFFCAIFAWHKRRARLGDRPELKIFGRCV